jgi:putative DNA primase/helicase
MKVDQMMDALESLVYLDEERQAPFWAPTVDGKEALETIPVSYLAFRNGILDLETEELRPHSPGFFCINVVPFDFDFDAPAPKRWLHFLHELWPGAENKRTRLTIQEMFGWYLAGDCSLHKIGLIVGVKRSGKTTISRVLEELVGTENVVSPRLSNLANQFGMASLIDKRVAIIQDARIGPRTDVHAVTENLLSISGGGKQTIPQKYRDDWSGYLQVRFLIISNEMPRIVDASGTIASRYVPLLTTRSFLGKEDLALMEKLRPELPGIANWALKGWFRLQERSYFVLPETSIEATRQLEELASPEVAFVKECCLVGINRRIEKKVIFSAWRKWCEEHGHRPGSMHVFARNVRAAYPQVRPSRESNGERRRLYLGIELKEDVQDELEEWALTKAKKQ